MQFRQDLAAQAVKSGSIKIFIRKDHIYQVMGHQSPLLPGRLGNADIQFPVNLK
jgi:hypothetical protein